MHIRRVKEKEANKHTIKEIKGQRKNDNKNNPKTTKNYPAHRKIMKRNCIYTIGHYKRRLMVRKLRIIRLT